jgi:hypothetical protein
MNGLQSYDNLYQDSREWLKMGWQDYIVPQVYWALGRTGGHPDFAVVARDWSGNTFGRHIYLGVGVYKPDVAVQVPRIIDTTRYFGFYGNSFFRYEHLNKMLGVGGRYNYPAFLPPMPWKDSIPPNPPQPLHVKALAGNYFQVEWNAPAPAKDSGGVKRYNIYRSASPRVDIDDIANLVRSVKSSADFYIDTISHPSSVKYFYAVTAMDIGNNESFPTHEESVVIPEIVQLSKKFSNQILLARSYPPIAAGYVYFSYELSEPSLVWLTVIDKSENEILKIVDEYQQAGRYIAAANVEKLKDGDYTYRLTAGQQVLKRLLTVEH